MSAFPSPRGALALALWLSATTCAAHANPAHEAANGPEATRADEAERYRAARAAADGGDSATALARFGELAAEGGPLASWAALARAELLRASDPGAAAAEASRLQGEGFAGAARARRLEALALLDAERFAEAVPKLRAEVARAPDRSAAAALAMPLAAHLASLPSVAAREEALALYRRVATRAPLAEVGRRAAEKAEAVRASLPWGRRSALEELPEADRMAEARAYYEAMHHDEAARAYRAIARTASSPAVRCEARLMEGSALERARKRSEAAPILASVASRCTAPELRATAFYRAGRSYQAAGDREAAARQFLALAEAVPGHRLADDGLFLAARLAEDEGDAERARALLERLVQELPNGDMRGEAMFRLAWAARRAGDLEGAVERLAALAPAAGETGELLGRAAYWHGRTLADAGRTREAADAFVALAERYPLSFYAQQGLARLAAIDAGRVEAVLAAMRGEAGGPEALAKADSHPDADAEAAFARAEALLRAGDHASAEVELDAVGALGSAREPAKLVRAATLLAEAGQRARAMRLVRGRDDLFRRSMPTGPALALWRLAYPPAFSPLIEEAAAAEGIPASFVRAVAREESAFEPTAVSSARAYGLVQIILPTAREEARALGIEASPSTLRDPATNLRVGTRFMARLFRRYEACPALVPAAYNAGPGAVDRWLRGREGRAFDELVEDIPYDETRRYARRVLGSYGVYSWLDAGYLPLPATLLP